MAAWRSSGVCRGGGGGGDGGLFRLLSGVGDEKACTGTWLNGPMRHIAAIKWYVLRIIALGFV